MKLIFKGMLSGGYTAKVYLDWDGYGSSVEFPCDGEPYHIIKIGCAYTEWGEVFDGILHEMVEFHMCNMELCYQRWFRAGGDSGDVYFQMSHAEYSECISRATQGILCFLDIAKKEFDEYQTDMLRSKQQTKLIEKEQDDPNN